MPIDQPGGRQPPARGEGVPVAAEVNLALGVEVGQVVALRGPLSRARQIARFRRRQSRRLRSLMSSVEPALIGATLPAALGAIAKTRAYPTR